MMMMVMTRDVLVVVPAEQDDDDDDSGDGDDDDDDDDDVDDDEGCWWWVQQLHRIYSRGAAASFALAGPHLGQMIIIQMMMITLFNRRESSPNFGPRLTTFGHPGPNICRICQITTF